MGCLGQLKRYLDVIPQHPKNIEKLLSPSWRSRPLGRQRRDPFAVELRDRARVEFIEARIHFATARQPGEPALVGLVEAAFSLLSASAR